MKTCGDSDVGKADVVSVLCASCLGGWFVLGVDLCAQITLMMACESLVSLLVKNLLCGSWIEHSS